MAKRLSEKKKVWVVALLTIVLACPIAIANNALFSSGLFSADAEETPEAAKQVIQTITKKEAATMSGEKTEDSTEAEDEAEKEAEEANEAAEEEAVKQAQEQNEHLSEATTEQRHSESRSSSSSTNSSTRNSSTPSSTSNTSTNNSSTPSSTNDGANNSNSSTADSTVTPSEPETPAAPTGHWETRLVSEAWTETVVTQTDIFRCMCGLIFDSPASWEAHRPVPCNGQHYKYTVISQDQTSYVEHPAVYEDVWVEG